MKHFSHTRISTFNQCELRYKFKYVDHADPSFDNTVEAFMGDLVHRTLEKIYTDLKYEKKNSVEDLIEHYHGLWDDEWSEDILVVKDEYDADNYKAQGERMIRDYYDSYHPFDHETIGIETQHRYELTADHDVSIRIDRLDNPEDGVYEIHDYKTSNHLPSQDEAEADTQLATYALGVKDMYPDAENIRLIWHYLAFDKEVVVEKSWAELDAIEEQLVNVIHEIEDANSYEPTKSPLCDYCGYQPQCPLWKDKYEDLPSDIDVDELIDEFISLRQEQDRVESRLEDIKADLNTYLDANNIDRVFDDNGRSIYRWSKDVTKFPYKSDEQHELWEALDALNILDDYLKVDTWLLENEFEELDELHRDILGQLGDPQRIERFYVDD
jgi:putative RecB family exonuclease